MNPPNSPPRWARQLTEDEAVWSAYQRRRVLRALLGKRDSLAKLSPEAADQLDWLAAEREVGRTVEIHGQWSDEAR